MAQVYKGTRLFGERRNSNLRKIGESNFFLAKNGHFHMKEFRSTTKYDIIPASFWKGHFICSCSSSCFPVFFLPLKSIQLSNKQISFDSQQGQGCQGVLFPFVFLLHAFMPVYSEAQHSERAERSAGDWHEDLEAKPNAENTFNTH